MPKRPIYHPSTESVRQYETEFRNRDNQAAYQEKRTDILLEQLERALLAKRAQAACVRLKRINGVGSVRMRTEIQA